MLPESHSLEYTPQPPQRSSVHGRPSLLLGNSQLRPLSDALCGMVASHQEFGQVVRMAYCSQGQVLIDEEALYLLQKYASWPIAFLGFVGDSELAKSFIIDTMLNLSGRLGSHVLVQFTELGPADSEAMYLWSVPYCPNTKTRLFLVSCSGISQAYPLERTGQMLLDMMLLLCSSIVVVNVPHLEVHKARRIFAEDKATNSLLADQSLDPIVKQLTKAHQRLVYSQPGQNEPFGPKLFHFLQPFRFTPQLRKELETHFPGSTCQTIDTPLAKGQTTEQLLDQLRTGEPRLNGAYFKKAGALAVEWISSVQVKEWQGLKLNGNVVCKLLINASKYISKKPHLKIDKVFTALLKQLYEASLAVHSSNYQDILKQKLTSQHPFKFDDLLNIFQDAQTAIMTSFNQNIVNPTLHLQYQSRLLKFIEHKQQLVLDINRRKTSHAIKGEVKTLQKHTKYEPQYIRKFIEQLRNMALQHDHEPTNIIVEQLLKYTNNLEERIIEQKKKVEKQKIKQLKQKCKDSITDYNHFKELNNEVRRDNLAREKQYKGYLKEVQQYEIQYRSIRKEIQAERKFQKEFIVSKGAQEQVADQLLEEIRELQEKVRDNHKQIDEIEKAYEYNPDILDLQKQLEDKEKQIKLIDKNQSKMQSQLQNSLMRTALSKPPDGKSSAFRQVVQKPSQLKERKPVKRLTSSKK